MKFIVQRVNKSQVEVEEKIVGKIDRGFMVLIGITHNDTKEIRSEERRVGKECRSRWSPYH